MGEDESDALMLKLQREVADLCHEIAPALYNCRDPEVIGNVFIVSIISQITRFEVTIEQYRSMIDGFCDNLHIAAEKAIKLAKEKMN